MKNLVYTLLYKLSGKLPLRIISDDGRPYLERYYIGTFMHRRVYLHRFVGSDPKRGWHDHPWYPAVSLVLWGEYGEERCTPLESEYKLRNYPLVQHPVLSAGRVRWYNILTKCVAHRVVIGNDWTEGVDGERFTSRSKECWTLFVHPEDYTTPWGFWNKLKHSSGMRWQSFDGGEGSKTSGYWWNSAPIGKHHPQRIPSL